MEKAYRTIVLVGLLIWLIVNAFATYSLRADVADLDARLSTATAELSSKQDVAIKNISKITESATDQLAEHERLISQLENMYNYTLDN